MKKATTLFLFVCILCGPLYAGTSLLTGTLTDAQGNPLNGFLVMQLPMSAQDPATNTLISPVPVNFKVTNGAIQSGPPLFDVMTINPTGLYYAARAYDTAGNLFLYGNYIVTGSTFSLSSAIPTTVTTSNVSFVNPANINGNNTFTGANTFTSTTIFSGTQTFQTATIFDVSGTGCTKTLNLLNTDSTPTNPNKYLRINQSTGALEFMSNACSLVASLSDNGNFTASNGFCIGASCITAWPSSAFSAGGDLSGSPSSQQVIGLQGKALPSLTKGYLYYNGSAWVLQQLVQSTRLTGSATTFTYPVSYSSTPTCVCTGEGGSCNVSSVSTTACTLNIATSTNDVIVVGQP